MNKKPLLPVKSDFIFKLIFGDQRNIDILTSFLKSVLDIPDEEYDHLMIVDPHVKRETSDDKYGILDVKVHTKNGRIIHVEIQLWFVPEMKERSVYYQAKMVTEQLSSGQDYSEIKKIVSIIITDYTLIPENDHYHNQFRYRTKDGTEYTDLIELNTLELPKLPLKADSSQLWYWMTFIKSDNEEEIAMLEQQNPQMRKAVGILKELSEDERTRMLLEEREKARRDIASMIGGARREGIQQGIQQGMQQGINEQKITTARNAISLGLETDYIMKLTGLSRKEIDSLR